PEAFASASEWLMPDGFYRAGHQRIFATMMQQSDRGQRIALVTVTTMLANERTLDEIEGGSYLTDLPRSVPPAANITYYSKIVEEKALLRRLIRTATDIVTSSFDKEDEIEDVLNDAEKNILEVSSRNNSGAFKAIKDVLIDVYDNIEQLQQNDGDVTGVASGFKD